MEDIMSFKKIFYKFLVLGVFFTIMPSNAGWVPVYAQWQDPEADLTTSGHLREASKKQKMLVSDANFTYDPLTQTGGNNLVRVKTKGFKIRDDGRGLLYWPRKKSAVTQIYGSKYNAGIAFHAVNLASEAFLGNLDRLTNESTVLWRPLREQARTVRARFMAQPVTVYPNSFEDLNAYYDPSTDEIHTGYITLQDGTIFQVGLSSEVLSHEEWHRNIHYTRPDFLTQMGYNTQSGGMHEGISDFGSVQTVAEMQEFTADLMHKSGGDLNSPAFQLIGQVGEGFGKLFGDQALRHVREDLRMPGVDLDMPIGTDFILPKAQAQVHDIGRVFSGAQWDAMHEAFNYFSDQQLYKQPEDLFRDVVHHTMDVTLAGLMLDDHTNASDFSDIATQMVHISNGQYIHSQISQGFNWGETFERHFGRRGILIEHDMTRAARLHKPVGVYATEHLFDTTLSLAGGASQQPERKYLFTEDGDEDA